MIGKWAVYIVDDDKAVRDSLCWLLESVGHQVFAFSSGAEFIAAYDPTLTSCLILDVRMPGMSGLELQECLTSRSIPIPVIFVTGHGDVPMAVRALQAGAVDFVQKPFSDQLLLDRIQQCLAQDAQRRTTQSRMETLLARVALLTGREREILDRVVSGRQNKSIAQELGISIKTVETHRAHIMEKMHVDSLAELVAACIACGIHPGKP